MPEPDLLVTKFTIPPMRSILLPREHLLKVLEQSRSIPLTLLSASAGFGKTTLLSAWASLWAGYRLYDVESGYRVFRAAALVDALAYYRGWKYSETVEVAVVLGRRKAKVRNDVLVPVPVSRSRTRLVDFFVDAGMIPVAAMRVWLRRGGRGGRQQPVR